MMRVSRIAFLTAAMTMMPAALAIEAGQIDDFENGTTQAWTEGPSPNLPTNQASGGPQGANDNFLRNVSNGSTGAGGKMVMLNRLQWAGNYDAAGITSIRLWLVNLGNTPMQMRVALQSGATWFASTNAFSLPADGVWRQANFELNDNSMTRVQGSVSLSMALGSVSEMRILSASIPQFRGDTIAATLGVDDIEAVEMPPMLPKDFLDVVSLSDVNGNNTTDIGVLQFDPNINRNRLVVLDGGSGSEINSVNYQSGNTSGSTVIADANGDMIPEFGALVEGSLTGLVKDVTDGTVIGKPGFDESYETVAFLSLGNAGGGAGPGPDVAVVGLRPKTGRVLVQVKDIASGNLVKRIGFNRNYGPFAAAVLDNIGETGAREIAVLGINGSGKIRAQIKDARNGNLIGNVQFSKSYAPLFFASTPDASGNLTNLTVLGINGNGVIRAQTKSAVDGALVSTMRFNRNYAPVAFFSFADSNGSGGGEIGVVGVRPNGKVRAEVREIADGTLVNAMTFNSNYPPLDAIAVNGAAGTGQNEIAVLGEKSNGARRLQIRDLLSGDNVAIIDIP